MNQKAVTTTRHVCATLLLLITVFSGAQSIEYIDELRTTADGSTSYYATKSVTIIPESFISVSNGQFFIKIIPTNAPPSPDENYIKGEMPRVAVASEYDLTLMEVEEKTTSYSYYDGLGRLKPLSLKSF